MVDPDAPPPDPTAGVSRAPAKEASDQYSLELVRAISSRVNPVRYADNENGQFPPAERGRGFFRKRMK